MRSIDTTRTSELSCREHKGWPAQSRELLTTAAESSAPSTHLRRRRHWALRPEHCGVYVAFKACPHHPASELILRETNFMGAYAANWAEWARLEGPCLFDLSLIFHLVHTNPPSHPAPVCHQGHTYERKDASCTEQLM